MPRSCGAGASCDLQLREATLHAPSAIAEGSRVILYLEIDGFTSVVEGSATMNLTITE